MGAMIFDAQSVISGLFQAPVSAILHSTQGFEMNKYVIVGQSFDIQAPAYYANTAAEAKELKAEVESMHGIEFRIYKK